MINKLLIGGFLTTTSLTFISSAHAMDLPKEKSSIVAKKKCIGIESVRLLDGLKSGIIDFDGKKYRVEGKQHDTGPMESSSKVKTLLKLVDNGSYLADNKKFSITLTPFPKSIRLPGEKLWDVVHKLEPQIIHENKKYYVFGRKDFNDKVNIFSDSKSMMNGYLRDNLYTFSHGGRLSVILIPEEFHGSIATEFIQKTLDDLEEPYKTPEDVRLTLGNLLNALDHNTLNLEGNEFSVQGEIIGEKHALELEEECVSTKRGDNYEFFNPEKFWFLLVPKKNQPLQKEENASSLADKINPTPITFLYDKCAANLLKEIFFSYYPSKTLLIEGKPFLMSMDCTQEIAASALPEQLFFQAKGRFLSQSLLYESYQSKNFLKKKYNQENAMWDDIFITLTLTVDRWS